MEDHDKVIALLKDKGPLSSKDIGEALGISPKILSKYLKTLTRERVVNTGINGYWIPYTSTINPQTQIIPELYAQNNTSISTFDDSIFYQKYKDETTRTFCDHGTTRFGVWKAETTYTPAKWEPNLPLRICVNFITPDDYWTSMGSENIQPTHVLLLVTAERTFDADGIFRLPSDNGMSTLLTPTGLPIEGGVQGAVSPRAGYIFRTPVNKFALVPVSAMSEHNGFRKCTFSLETTLPDDLPPGLYRLRIDYGLRIGTRLLDLNMMAFARSGLLAEQCDTESYSPLIPASARHVSGRMVDGTEIVPRMPWVLLKQYNSNGYRGVVANEDEENFALSSRNLIQDDVILPLFSETKPYNNLSYSLEPQFPTDRFEKKRGIPWMHIKGELSVQIFAPNGSITDLGTAAFTRQEGRWLTTGNPEITKWAPPMYGKYVVRATLWTEDIWGDRYEGGGTYAFWIAKRMTLSTAIFQGQSFQVGYNFGPSLTLAPAVAAYVQVSVTLYPNSDPAEAKTTVYSGKANSAGSFGRDQGVTPVHFERPGEYLAHTLAKYSDVDGNLWVCTYRHAGVVYPRDSQIVARGKKLENQGEFVERGATQSEGLVDIQNSFKRTDHVNFPYRAGDVLLIASEMQKANKIVPVIMWEEKENPISHYQDYKGVTSSNVIIRTGNGYSPHLFPEYITDWQYFYAAAPRPGFMGRFLVAENGAYSSYWPVSPNNFGNQINASPNGDIAGDIYRLLGGVVIRPKDKVPMYAGYMASGVIISGLSNNNRVIAPGSEAMAGPDGRTAHYFLSLNARPGAVYETGSKFVPAFQIDPIVPARITFRLLYPDGSENITEGVVNEYGYFVGKQPWTFSLPGVYYYTVLSDWNGHEGIIPGMPAQGGEFYVIESKRPSSTGGLTFDLPPLSTFDPESGTTFTGHSTAKTVHFAAVIPGAVLAQGTLPVEAGEFRLDFRPKALNSHIRTYDNINLANGNPHLSRVVHFTFFSHETEPVEFHDFVRLIIRGNTVHYTAPTPKPENSHG